jgi:hypothetical protein
MLRSAVLLATPALLTVLGCGGGGDGETPDASISAACQEAVDHSDLAWIQENIFDRSCVFSACHQGAAGIADGLNLEPGMSEANVVGVDSMRDPAFKLVVAGDADSSYLLMILGRDPAGNNPTIDRRMPLSSPALCDEKLDALGRCVNSL